jgi:UPF0271 protein
MHIDLNADVGEGFGIWRLGDDEGMLRLITSANVACGFHGGDPTTMRRVCELAAERDVVIGAQVGYRDLPGFGRRRIDIDPDTLRDDVLYQLGALAAFAAAAGSRMRYVKPHGALYNTAADDAAQADAVAAAVAEFDATLPLLGLPGSMLATAAADHDLGFVAEAFADRGYCADGRLVARSQPGAVLTDPAAAAARAVAIARDGRVSAADGTDVPVRADSLCVHGDTPGAVAMAEAVRAALLAADVDVRAFTR